MVVVNQDHIEQLGSISKLNFRVTIGISSGLSIASVVARVGYRIHVCRSLYLDDYVVLAGAVCLCAATGLVYRNCDNYFLGGAMQLDPSLFLKVSPDRTNELLKSSNTYLYAFLALIWTTIFAVKISFLAFFKKLIQRVTKIQKYYWIVVVITLISWIFLMVEPLVLCPHFGYNSLKCYDPSRDLLYVSMSGLITGLDVLTDIFIVSIPIIILRKAKIKTQQKVAFGSFLCLSLVMATIALVRVTRIYGAAGIDLVWQIFWQTMEGCVALLMTSITAFRTVFASQDTRGRGQMRWAPSHSWIQRATQRKRNQESDMLEKDWLPSIPRAQLTGMATYIRGYPMVGETISTGSEMRFPEEDDESQFESVISH